MLPFFDKSLARKTLLSLSLSIGAIIILMTVIIYQHIVSVITEKSIGQLEIYAAERSNHEGNIFELAAENHAALKARILSRLAEGAPDPKARFDALNERFADGTVRTRLEGFDGARDPFVFIGRNVRIDADIRRRVMLFWELSRDFGPAWHHRLQNIYFTMPENILVGYWPEVPDWAHRASADLSIPDEEYFRVSDPVHNPSRRTVLTGLFFDPPSQAWMVSVETPVDIGGRHVATIGHDVLLNELMENVAKNNLKGAYSLIFTRDGRLISHPELMDEIKANNGKYDINRHGDANLKRIFQAVTGNKTGKRIIENAEDGEYLAMIEMKGTGWYFISVYPKQLVSNAAWDTAEIVLVLGVISALAGILFLY